MGCGNASMPLWGINGNSKDYLNYVYEFVTTCNISAIWYQTKKGRRYLVKIQQKNGANFKFFEGFKNSTANARQFDHQVSVGLVKTTGFHRMFLN
jgi:hypothetical protein